MADPRRYELDELTNRPGTYFNPQTEVLLIVDDSPDVDHEIFDDVEPGGKADQGKRDRDENDQRRHHAGREWPRLGRLGGMQKRGHRTASLTGAAAAPCGAS